MCGDQDVARSSGNRGDARRDVGSRIRIAIVAAVSEGVVRDRVQAVAVDDVQTPLALARLPGPRSSAGRVTGRVNDLQLQLADADGLARAERHDVTDAGRWFDDLELRIVAIDFAGAQSL